MQSSPPSRAWERPSSRADSQYSIDLAALDLGSRSGASSPLPTQHVDKVFSEDIDGPSDFTQNMEAWMRGGTLKKGTLKGGLQSWKERKAEVERQNDEQDHETLLMPNKEAEDEHSASHHTPSNSRPRESVFEDRTHNIDGEEASSEWDPYAEAATPQPPPAHKHFLQPTVEEYYSEISPAQVMSTQSLRRKSSIVEESPPNSIPSSTPGRPSSETISPTRSPVFSRTSTGGRQYSSQTDEASFERKLDQLQARCQKLEHLNSALSQAVDEERRMRRTEKADAERKERDLTEMKDQAYVHKEDFRKEFVALKERVQEQDGETQRLRSENDAKEQQMKRKDVQYERVFSQLEDDLQTAERSRDEADGRASAAERQLALQSVDHGEELSRTQAALGADGGHAALTEQLRLAKVENEKLKDGKKAADAVASYLRNEMAAIKDNQAEVAGRVATERQRIVSLAEDLQGQLQNVRHEQEDQQAVHKSNIERLKSEHSEAQPAASDDAEKLRTELNEAILERDEAQDSLESLQAELEAAKIQVADLEAVNTALDSRVSDAIRRREIYWRGRLEEVENDRRIMAKTLMQQWGEAEVGVNEPQRYEYRFVKDAKAGA